MSQKVHGNHSRPQKGGLIVYALRCSRSVQQSGGRFAAQISILHRQALAARPVVVAYHRGSATWALSARP